MRLDLDHPLGNDRAMIQFGRDKMHRTSVKTHTSINRTLMRVQTRKGRQQRGMDIDHPVFVMRHKGWGQYPHKTGQYDQTRFKGVDGRLQGRIIGCTIGIIRVGHYCHRNARITRQLQTGRIGPV